MKKVTFLSSMLMVLIVAGCKPSNMEIALAVEGTLQAIDTATPVIIMETVEIPVEVTAEVEVTRLIEVTRKVEFPVTVTYTPGPSPTSTDTTTPTPSLTPTATPTPFNVAGCMNLQSVPNYWNIDEDEYKDKLYPFYNKYNGKCVKFYFKDGLGIIGTDYGWLKPISRLVTLIIDEASPAEITKSFVDYSTVWGIWKEKSPGKYQILLRRVSQYPPLQQPIEYDGFYMVGDDYDISAGQWKSLWPPGTVDNCYWARTNPNTGYIKDNHFGLAGIYVRLYEGDMFESDDCAPWIFVSPQSQIISLIESDERNLLLDD